MREDLEEIVRIGAKWMDEVSMTTNGTLLSQEKSRSLSRAGLNRINVSLDSFDGDLYRKITSGKIRVSKIIENLKKASEFFDSIKINMVLLKNVNESEIPDMIRFSKDNGCILQLIELQPLYSSEFDNLFLDLSEIEEMLSSKATRINVRKMQNRKKYFIDGAEVEVVKPMHNSEFCRNCRRIRVTSDGKIKPCLMRNDNLVDGLTAFQINGLGGLEKALREGINRRKPFWSSEYDRYIGQKTQLEKSKS